MVSFLYAKTKADVGQNSLNYHFFINDEVSFLFLFSFNFYKNHLTRIDSK